MSDNIPFEIQMEIIKKVYDIKSLVQFRSVSKQWKSFIDTSDFINGYNAQPHSFLILSRYTTRVLEDDEVRYIRLVLEDDDDKNETFKVKEQELAPAVVSPLIKQFSTTEFVGSCHGLVCLYSHRYQGYDNKSMLVIWNPSIGKSFGIGGIVPKYVSESYYRIAFGFGVSPVTNDPTVVKILYVGNNMPFHVEVFTLSSGVWNVIPSANLPRQSIELILSSQVVIDRFIYWGALDRTFTDDDDDDDDDDDYDDVDDDDAAINLVILSFDLITNEFKAVDLPNCFKYKSYAHVWVSVSKLRESLVVYGTTYVGFTETCSVWVMQHDSSFKKLFSIGARIDNILGFRETGEPIIETPTVPKLHVYDPCSQQINDLGIDGSKATFVMGSYKESLLLLDHSDLHIYCDDN